MKIVPELSIFVNGTNRTPSRPLLALPMKPCLRKANRGWAKRSRISMIYYARPPTKQRSPPVHSSFTGCLLQDQSTSSHLFTSLIASLFYHIPHSVTGSRLHDQPVYSFPVAFLYTEVCLSLLLRFVLYVIDVLLGSNYLY